MKERIFKIIKYKNLTHVAFAQKLGVQPSSVTHILNGRNKPSLNFIIKIINAFPEISIEWLLSGKGNMIKSDFLDQNQNNINKKSTNEIVSEVRESDLFIEHNLNNNSLITNNFEIDENEENLSENQEIENKIKFQHEKKDIKKSLSENNNQITSEITDENPIENDKNIRKEKKLKKPIHVLLIFEDDTYDFLSLRNE